MPEPRYKGKPQKMIVCGHCNGSGAKPGSLIGLSNAKTSEDAAFMLRMATCGTCKGSGRLKEPS